MTSSDSKYEDDSFFDDDDDELLQKLILGQASVENNIVVPTQTNNTSIQSSGDSRPKAPILETSGDNNALKSRLYQAEGEVAILRSQLQLLQQQKIAEVSKLQSTYYEYKNATDEQVNSLKFDVEKLQDEKKFLDNELRTLTVKKRKINGTHVVNPVTAKQESLMQTPPPVVTPVSVPVAPPNPLQQQRVMNTTNDSSMFMDQLWNHCIIGSNRTSLNYLSKICLDFDLKINDFLLVKRTPVSSAIIDYFMEKKHLRLDDLIDNFCTTFIEVCMNLLEKKFIISVPFLLSLIYCALSYRPAAISQRLISKLFVHFTKIASDFSFLLDSNLNEEDFINYHDVANQVMILEKFIFISCHDILERLTLLATLHGSEFIKAIWQDEVLPIELIRRCLPENSERFVNSAQINLAYNFVEMLNASVTDDTFAYNDNSQLPDTEIFSSLLKIFLIDIPIKDDFMFYGLNRILGNNTDFEKIDSTVPLEHDSLGNTLIILPQPIPFELLDKNQNNSTMKYNILFNHENHLLNLRIRVASLIENYIINRQTVAILQNKEYFKSLIRIIGFEQISILNSPRSQYIDKRIQIISKMIKIIYYITQDITDVRDLIFPETMYELFVVILRVAFSTDSLSTEAQKFLSQVRTSGHLTIPIFNESCESKARDLNHITISDTDGKLIADIQADYANGLEFPYESDTVELAREILNQFVTHQEADNIYFSMNYEEDGGFDEMELVQ